MGGQLCIGWLASVGTQKRQRTALPFVYKQREQLSDYIDKQSRSTKAGRLTGGTLRAYISEQLQINYHPNAVYKLLHRFDFSWITSCSKHPKQLQTTQDEFKKTAN